jgi:hypothetical protein
MNKTCSRCGKTKSEDEFYKTGGYCKRCMDKSRKIRRKKILCTICGIQKRIPNKKYCSVCEMFLDNPKVLKQLIRLKEQRNNSSNPRVTTAVKYDEDDMWAANRFYQERGYRPSLVELESYIEEHKPENDSSW